MRWVLADSQFRCLRIHDKLQRRPWKLNLQGMWGFQCFACERRDVGKGVIAGVLKVCTKDTRNKVRISSARTRIGVSASLYKRSWPTDRPLHLGRVEWSAVPGCGANAATIGRDCPLRCDAVAAMNSSLRTKAKASNSLLSEPSRRVCMVLGSRATFNPAAALRIAMLFASRRRLSSEISRARKTSVNSW